MGSQPYAIGMHLTELSARYWGPVLCKRAGFKVIFVSSDAVLF